MEFSGFPIGICVGYPAGSPWEVSAAALGTRPLSPGSWSPFGSCSRSPSPPALPMFPGGIPWALPEGRSRSRAWGWAPRRSRTRDRSRDGCGWSRRGGCLHPKVLTRARAWGELDPRLGSHPRGKIHGMKPSSFPSALSEGLDGGGLGLAGPGEPEGSGGSWVVPPHSQGDLGCFKPGALPSPSGPGWRGPGGGLAPGLPLTVPVPAGWTG